MPLLLRLIIQAVRFTTIESNDIHMFYVSASQLFKVACLCLAVQKFKILSK